jgi:phage gp29-like protein
MKEVKLYGPNGEPITAKALEREASGTLGSVRGTDFDSAADKLTPAKLASILSAMQEDPTEFLTLAIEMEERELHYGSVLSTRKLAVSGIEPTVEAASDDKHDMEIAEAVRRLVEAPEFVELVEDLLDALGKGFSVSEIIWQTGSDLWKPVGYKHRDPRWFKFDYEHGEELRLKVEGSDKGVPLDPYKFIVHYPRLRSGLKIRGGLARLACWSYLCKTYTVKDWMRFIELFGQPLRLGRYESTASDLDKEILKRAVTMLGVDAAAILPKGMEIDFQEISNTASGATLYEKCANWIDKQISKAVLGQTMTADDGSSQSQAKVHDGVREDILRADVRRLCATINQQLVERFVNVNFGIQENYPKVKIPIPDWEDLKAWTDNVAKMVERGLRVGQKHVRDKLNLPEPEDGEELLMPPTSPSGPAGALNRRTATRAAHTALNAKANDDLEEILADALSGADEIQDETIVPIRDALLACNSYEEMEAALLELVGGIDMTRFTQRLAIAQFKARGTGDAVRA